MARPRINEWPEWPNARDWIGIATFCLTVMILWMIKGDPELRSNEFFKNVALLIIGTGFINGAVSWAYSVTKTGSEIAESQARVVEKSTPAAPPADEPQKVIIDQPAGQPVPVDPQPSEEHDGSWMQQK